MRAYRAASDFSCGHPVLWVGKESVVIQIRFFGTAIGLFLCERFYALVTTSVHLKVELLRLSTKVFYG